MRERERVWTGRGNAMFHARHRFVLVGGLLLGWLTVFVFVLLRVRDRGIDDQRARCERKHPVVQDVPLPRERRLK